ncbi:MAG TPA: O-antigen ligase family protein [Gaiellaceae bacterium]|nr:O-antigen ligase family protein [Gaiellaceae bacterium]
MKTLRRATDFFLLAAFFCVTFEKVHWNVAGTVGIADVLTILFLIAFALRARTRWPRTSTIVLGFLAAFLLLYLLGFFNLETKQALSQYTKGMVKFVLHFLFLACAVTYLAERGERFFWRTVGWFTAGFGANAIYGVLQLLAARAGHNLDSTVLSPLTGGASAINLYGIVNGASVYRPNALTGDPNHLGIMLDVPLLALTPVYLRLGRGHRLRWPLGLLLAFLLLVLASTLSRSGALGLLVGLLILAVPYRRFVWSRALLVPLAGVALVLGYFAETRRHFISTVIHSRLKTSGTSGTSVHFSVYGFIPHVIHSHPLLGLGQNTFSVYYEFVTGKTNWGPHSFWVALIVETGLLGALLFLVFLRYVYLRLKAARMLGRLRADRRVLPLAWGLTAALTGTIASNFFYLTMQFYYFYAFVALALALPVVFAKRTDGYEAATSSSTVAARVGRPSKSS